MGYGTTSKRRTFSDDSTCTIFCLHFEFSLIDELQHVLSNLRPCSNCRTFTSSLWMTASLWDYHRGCRDTQQPPHSHLVSLDDCVVDFPLQSGYCWFAETLFDFNFECDAEVYEDRRRGRGWPPWSIWNWAESHSVWPRSCNVKRSPRVG